MTDEVNTKSYKNDNIHNNIENTFECFSPQSLVIISIAPMRGITQR